MVRYHAWGIWKELIISYKVKSRTNACLLYTGVEAFLRLGKFFAGTPQSTEFLFLVIMSSTPSDS